MSILRLDKNVPTNYVKESRDFLVLLRLLTMAESNVKYNVDSIQYLNDPFLINNRLLHLLCTKVGFYTHKNFTDDELRYILSSFIQLIRNKGSIIAIESAINLYLKINCIEAETEISVDNKNYVVNIGISANARNIVILEELFRYLLPTGYLLNIYFFQNQPIYETFGITTDYSIINITTTSNLEIDAWPLINHTPNYKLAITTFDRDDINSIESIQMGSILLKANKNLIINEYVDDSTETVESILNFYKDATSPSMSQTAIAYVFNEKIVLVLFNMDFFNSFKINYYVNQFGNNISRSEGTTNKNISATWQVNYATLTFSVKDFAYYEDEPEDQIINDMIIFSDDNRVIRHLAEKIVGDDGNTLFSLLILDLNTNLTNLRICRMPAAKNIATTFIHKDIKEKA